MQVDIDADTGVNALLESIVSTNIRRIFTLHSPYNPMEVQLSLQKETSS